MSGISASSAYRSPMRGTMNGTRTEPSKNPVPKTSAKYAIAPRKVFDGLVEFTGVFCDA